MSAQSNVAPIIIKKKKVTGGDGHHGGAWKVAYADFVTAMMAFFLLMWLLNATTEKQRKGLADYFSPTIPISQVSGGGNGAFGGDSMFAEETRAHNGTGASQRYATEAMMARGATGVAQAGSEANAHDAEVFTEIENDLLGRSGESAIADMINRHIVTRVTDEGLLIELFDTEEAQLFDPGTDTPTPLMEQLVAIVASTSGMVINGIAVEGHTRAQPIVTRDNPVWPLSTARAETVRQMLIKDGVRSERLMRITGHADREPVRKNTMALRNNRIEIIILRSDI